MANAEILSTGEELLSGSLVDTNAPWLAQRLLELGFQVRRISCVGDDLQSLNAVMQEIAGRSDLAILTGGLGPTADDVTAQAAAVASGTELVQSDQALQSMRDFFARLQKEIPASNLKQALLPAESSCLPNRGGTAPGFLLRIRGCYFYALPGVPKEMKRMFSDWVAPDIQEFFAPQLQPLRIREVSCFGITESKTSQALEDFEAKFPEISLGFRFEFPVIHVRLYARQKINAPTGQELEESLSWIVQKLGDKVYSQQGRSLQEESLRMLQASAKTLAVAEAYTGGLLAHLISSVEHGQQTLLLARIGDAEEQESSAASADRQEMSLSMARRIREETGADYALSTVRSQAACQSWVGLATRERALAREMSLCYPDSQANIKALAYSALNLLRLELLGRLD